jgi:hypothetical protein
MIRVVEEDVTGSHLARTHLWPQLQGLPHVRIGQGEVFEAFTVLGGVRLRHMAMSALHQLLELCFNHAVLFFEERLLYRIDFAVNARVRPWKLLGVHGRYRG